MAPPVRAWGCPVKNLRRQHVGTRDATLSPRARMTETHRDDTTVELPVLYSSGPFQITGFTQSSQNPQRHICRWPWTPSPASQGFYGSDTPWDPPLRAGFFDKMRRKCCNCTAREVQWDHCLLVVLPLDWLVPTAASLPVGAQAVQSTPWVLSHLGTQFPEQ